MYKHEQHHITPSSEGHKNDIQRRSTVGSRCMNYEPMGKSLRVNHKPVCARPRPTIHFINTNFMSDISCRKPDTALSSLESKRCSKPANLASTPANLASTPANLASMSLRKSPISRRTSAKPCSMSRRTSTTCCFVATFNEACDSCTASVTASACWSLNPAPLSLRTNLCVSNVNAGSAINQFSLPRILSRQPLTSSDETAYIAAQVLKTPALAAKSPRQSAAFISPVGFAPMGGRAANTRPEREIRPPTRCGFQRLPAPC